jgi:hypothetical protein
MIPTPEDGPYEQLALAFGELRIAFLEAVEDILLVLAKALGRRP